MWFNTSRANILTGVIIFTSIVLFYIFRSRKGKKFFIRELPAIRAIPEAVGRATEMGRPVLFSTGLSTLQDLGGLAAISILREVAGVTARNGVELIVPCYDSMMLSVTEEVVREAYLRAGRAGWSTQGKVFFVAGRQFAYAAGVSGIMIREKTAAHLFMGVFLAESLILAEGGSLTGTIQLAGTDSVTQLPFFITTCDYTLIGEELYAAGAYLGREPSMLGSLIGQDVVKLIIATIIVTGVFLGTVDVLTDEVFHLKELLTTFFKTH